MQIQEIELSELKPYEKNAKKHPAEQVEHIANSLREFGWKQPIVIDRDNVIIAGHGRLLAAKSLGWITAPCIYADDLTEDQVKAFRLADNKTAESDWDFTLLSDELDDIALDMSQFGFADMFNEPDDEDADVIEDEIPNPPAEPKAKPGDIYELGGGHRLICGDSTDPEVITRLLDGAEIDLLLTDPPYNVNMGSVNTPTKSNIVAIQNDNMDPEDFIAFLSKALYNANTHMRPGAAYYIWYAGLHHIEFESALRRIEDFKLHEQLVWVKTHFVLGRNSDYQWMHELALYGWKSGAPHYFTDSRAEGTVIEDQNKKLNTLKKEELIKLCEKLMGIDKQTTVLHAEKPMSADMHPTVKPQGLLAPLILNSSKRGDNVLDLFGGSGSTLIACQQLGRRCYMCELDPHYIDVIIERWETMTGDKAVLLNGTQENRDRPGPI